jgi:hypothetical protein
VPSAPGDRNDPYGDDGTPGREGGRPAAREEVVA